MARVVQFVILAEHKPGTLAHICSELAAKAVNISAIMAAHDQPGGVRIVAAPQQATRKILDAMKIPFREEEAIAVRITDRPGALGKLTRKLADAGINIQYAYGSIVKGEQRALIVMGVSDLDKAEKLL
ncbi:MAG: ACT domain-containing protein [Acidobacteria bacterium]|nr:ACT domain-containing protein [Acidobacteriaceae bacterium]MBV9610283.1 ACT domain-containing protein [Acidobacteriota bacterium]